MDGRTRTCANETREAQAHCGRCRLWLYQLSYTHKKKSDPRPLSRPDWDSGGTPQDDPVFHARALSCRACLYRLYGCAELSRQSPQPAAAGLHPMSLAGGSPMITRMVGVDFARRRLVQSSGPVGPRVFDDPVWVPAPIPGFCLVACLSTAPVGRRDPRIHPQVRLPTLSPRRLRRGWSRWPIASAAALLVGARLSGPSRRRSV